MIRANPLIWWHLDPLAGEFVLVDDVSRNRFVVATSVVDVLAYARVWRSRQDVTAFVRRRLKSGRKAPAWVAETLDRGLLVRRNHPANAFQRQRMFWSRFGWEAAFDYHLATRDFPFVDYTTENVQAIDWALMEEYGRAGAKPPIYKDVRGLGLVRLPRCNHATSGAPKSGALADGSVTQHELSQLLYYTFGEIGSMRLHVLGKSLLKTSPSGGARHPAEAYVIACGGTFVPRGTYHYSVRRHALERLSTREWNDLQAIFFQLTHHKGFEPAMVIIITSLVERSMWRYRESRSMRVLLLDVGHLLATLKRVGGHLGFRVIVGHGFDERALGSELGIDTASEMPLCFAAVARA